MEEVNDVKGLKVKCENYSLWFGGFAANENEGVMSPNIAKRRRRKQNPEVFFTTEAELKLPLHTSRYKH